MVLMYRRFVFSLLLLISSRSSASRSSGSSRSRLSERRLSIGSVVSLCCHLGRVWLGRRLRLDRCCRLAPHSLVSLLSFLLCYVTACTRSTTAPPERGGASRRRIAMLPPWT